MFKFLGGKPPENLDPYVLIEHTLRHRAKFCSDRPMQLGDLAVKKKKKCQQNISLLRKLSLPCGLTNKRHKTGLFRNFNAAGTR